MSTLRLVTVDALPVSQAGFIDCADVGCEVSGVRLNTGRGEQLCLNCYACRNLLLHDPLRGWRLKLNSRADIAQRREEARERHAPQIGEGWEALRKMRRVA